MADYRNSNYNRQPRYNTGSSKKSGGDVGYWMLAGFLLLCGAWPISLVMLIARLSGNKNKSRRAYERPRDENGRFISDEEARAQQRSAQAAYTESQAQRAAKHKPKKAAKVLMIIGGILAAIGLLASIGTIGELVGYGYYSYLMENLFSYLGFVVFGGGMYIGGLNMKRKDARIRMYLNIIGEQRLVLIKTLSSAAGVSVKRVYKDIEDMQEDGLLPANAYVDRARKCLVLDPAAMPYQMEMEAALQRVQADARAATAAASAAAAAPAAAPTPPIAEGTAGEYAHILSQIRKANDDIDDAAMSAKIEHIENIARSIFTIVEQKPERKQEIRSFFNYYLPTTQKLLNFYAQLEEQPVQGQTIVESRQNIEGIMDNLVKGFENQLDSLFRADAIDISTDISVLENMLAQDGLSGSVAEDAIARAAASRPAGSNLTMPGQPRTVPMGGSAGAMATQPMDLKN